MSIRNDVHALEFGMYFSDERFAMNWVEVIPAAVVVCAMFAGCNTSKDEKQSTPDSVPNVVTEDIQAGIEKHIEEQTRLGGGYFRLPHGETELRLRLVRVHTEYLANLGPRRHFACVDLANIDGDVYDVDFFLAGDPGAMTVTETTVHKVNGQPSYVWKQRRDKTWHRVPVEKAPPELLGVITGRDEFEFLYRAILPKMSDTARMWIPLPSTDSFQTVDATSIEAPGQWQVLDEHEHGNRVLFLTLGPQDSGKTVAVKSQVRRLEKGVYAAETPVPSQYLDPEHLVPADERFRSIAEEVVEGKMGDLARARALYDHVIDRMRYMKFGTGWGKGDAVYACDARTGNCTDFHSYFIALARAIGIPARFAIGAAIPSERNEGGIDGYHCWAEFYTDGRWWPVDISEGDKCSSLSTYYFGHHPANRIELSRGRDLVLEPGPASGPINFLAYPVLEVGGKPTRVKVEFSFKRNTSSKA
ncbi:MAG: transglutaminase domain-containing protein [Phycisphaerales bacterium]|nr:MAG: transglutaminase domain-containing protein [Phycisphaerales bacterium]